MNFGDELRQMVQALSNKDKVAKGDAVPPVDPSKTGLFFLEAVIPETKPEATPAGAPQSFGPLRTEGSVPPAVGGLPPGHGGAPTQPTVDSSANKRNDTNVPSMFSGTGATATEKLSASTDKRKASEGLDFEACDSLLLQSHPPPK